MSKQQNAEANGECSPPLGTSNDIGGNSYQLGRGEVNLQVLFNYDKITIPHVGNISLIRRNSDMVMVRFSPAEELITKIREYNHGHGKKRSTWESFEEEQR